MGIFNFKNNTVKTVKPISRVESDPPAGIGFRRAYSRLRLIDVSKFEDELMYRAGWGSKNTLRAKMYGNSKLKTSDKAAIKEVFLRRGIDFETGELLGNGLDYNKN